MGFSKQWEETYSNSQHVNKWPWSDLVSYVMRFARPSGKDFRVLELGIGTGPNIPFFLDQEADFYGIDGSPSAVHLLKERYPKLRDKLVAADFTQTIPFDLEFDLIVDRGSLTHNSTESLKSCIMLIKKHLKTGARYIGIDWFSTLSFDYKRGEFLENDLNTIKNITEGRVANLGRVHFSDEAHLRALFDGFEFQVLDHNITLSEIPVTGYREAFWNFVAQKK